MLTGKFGCGSQQPVGRCFPDADTLYPTRLERPRLWFAVGILLLALFELPLQLRHERFVWRSDDDFVLAIATAQLREPIRHRFGLFLRPVHVAKLVVLQRDMCRTPRIRDEAAVMIESV